MSVTSFNEEECKYIKTATHNYISKDAIIDNPKVVRAVDFGSFPAASLYQNVGKMYS